MDVPADVSMPQFMDHPRTWRENLYVYPVISRRSRGVSIGINLNPDAACNFDCVYCQVDRSRPVRTREVKLDLLHDELREMLNLVTSGRLFAEQEFQSVPESFRVLRDIALSGDGEPTTCPVFTEAIETVVQLKQALRLDSTRIVLITDACYLTRPSVIRGLELMDQNNGEIWAKLDAGTETYYRAVNRPNYPLAHVMANIIAAAKARPIVIQSLFLRLHGQPPDETEIEAYCDRLVEVLSASGQIRYVQAYTVARWTVEAYAAPLTDAEVDAIATTITRRTGLPTEVFYAPAGYDRNAAPH